LIFHYIFSGCSGFGAIFGGFFITAAGGKGGFFLLCFAELSGGFSACRQTGF